MNFYSIREFAKETGKSEPWARNAARIGRIKAIKVGKTWVVERGEGERFIRAPFMITRKELGL